MKDLWAVSDLVVEVADYFGIGRGYVLYERNDDVAREIKLQQLFTSDEIPYLSL